MKTIGLFEAKTRLSEICEEVSSRGQPILVTRRGHPIVRIEPAASDQKARNVWISRQAWLEENGPIEEDFRTPDREPQAWRNPQGSAFASGQQLGWTWRRADGSLGDLRG